MNCSKSCGPTITIIHLIIIAGILLYYHITYISIIIIEVLERYLMFCNFIPSHAHICIKVKSVILYVSCAKLYYIRHV